MIAYTHFKTARKILTAITLFSSSTLFFGVLFLYPSEVKAQSSFTDSSAYELTGWLWNEVYGAAVLGPSSPNLHISDPNRHHGPTKQEVKENEFQNKPWLREGECPTSDVLCYLPYSRGAKSYGVSMQKKSDSLYHLFGHAWASNAGWIAFDERSIPNNACPDSNHQARLVKVSNTVWRLEGCAYIPHDETNLGSEIIYLGSRFKGRDSDFEITFNPTTKKFIGFALGQKSGKWSFGGANGTGLDVTAEPTLEDPTLNVFKDSRNITDGNVNSGATVNLAWDCKSFNFKELRKKVGTGYGSNLGQGSKKIVSQVVTGPDGTKNEWRLTCEDGGSNRFANASVTIGDVGIGETDFALNLSSKITRIGEPVTVRWGGVGIGAGDGDQKIVCDLLENNALINDDVKGAGGGYTEDIVDSNDGVARPKIVAEGSLPNRQINLETVYILNCHTAAGVFVGRAIQTVKVLPLGFGNR